MAANDVFVMTVPRAPYRCPPGPYERACMVADYLERRGRHGAKVVVLDANAIIRVLAGESLERNIATSSACYSPVTSKLASWLSANFAFGDIYAADGKVKGKGIHRLDLGEPPKITSDGYGDMFTWADRCSSTVSVRSLRGFRAVPQPVGGFVRLARSALQLAYR